MYLNLTIEILGLASLITLVMMTPLYDRVIKYMRADFKPFTCPKCLTFWLSLAYFHAQYSEIWYSILVAAIAAAVAGILDNQINLYNG